MNNDGKKDFKVYLDYIQNNLYSKIELQSDSTNKLEICSYNGWTYSPSVFYYDGYLKQLSINDTINQNKIWTPLWRFSTLYFELHFMNNILGNDNYIGVKFIDKNDTLYGWVRYSLKSEYELVIKDCAYQSK